MGALWTKGWDVSDYSFGSFGCRVVRGHDGGHIAANGL